MTLDKEIQTSMIIFRSLTDIEEKKAAFSTLKHMFDTIGDRTDKAIIVTAIRELCVLWKL